ncbi:MAG TPA: hypothetical protein VET87_01070 [Rubrivivax sp.]|nr:hypothetical protein [Rubrivivax sp.]
MAGSYIHAPILPARAKEDLVALARHPREQGAGVSVTRYWKAGNADYKKVMELKGVDLERYRGTGRGAGDSGCENCSTLAPMITALTL